MFAYVHKDICTMIFFAVNTLIITDTYIFNMEEKIMVYKLKNYGTWNNKAYY